MTDGAALGRNHIFSKLGKFITKAQISHFTLELSCPSVNGLEKSDTVSLLEFFEATEDISYQTLWDVPLINGKATLISCLYVDRDQGFAKIDHTDDPHFIAYHARAPRLLETAHECMKMPETLSQLLLHASMTHILCTFLLFPKVYYTVTAPAIATILTTICSPFLAELPHGVASHYPEGLATKPEEVLIPLGIQICTNQPV